MLFAFKRTDYCGIRHCRLVKPGWKILQKPLFFSTSRRQTKDEVFDRKTEKMKLLGELGKIILEGLGFVFTVEDENSL